MLSYQTVEWTKEDDNLVANHLYITYINSVIITVISKSLHINIHCQANTPIDITKTEYTR